MTFPPFDREPRPTERAAPKPRPPIVVTAGPVRAVFSWADDRWRHVILLDDSPWAESLEDQADGRAAAWPCSPPLVELSAVQAATGPAVLAVGLAGRSHFSASVTACPERPDALLFEIACRVREQPGWLGSTYDLGGERIRLGPPHGTGDLPATIRWAYHADRSGFHVVPPATLMRGG